MKHYFHFLFSAALLLGSLILFNNQKSDRPGQSNEHPQIEHIALQAEAPSRVATESLSPCKRYSTQIAGEFTSPEIRRSVIRDFNAYQVCLRRQLQIHLELKPQIAILSGSHFFQRTGYDDPPLS